MQLAVCGLHMRGLPLEHQLLSLGAKFQKACKSSPVYRLYAITDPVSKVRKPGMIATGEEDGAAIDVEVWHLPLERVGAFLQQIPAPLGLGTVCLESDEKVKGFICEGYIANLASQTQPHSSSLERFHVEDITKYGSWRTFIAHKS